MGFHMHSEKPLIMWNWISFVRTSMTLGVNNKAFYYNRHGLFGRRSQNNSLQLFCNANSFLFLSYRLAVLSLDIQNFIPNVFIIMFVDFDACYLCNEAELKTFWSLLGLCCLNAGDTLAHQGLMLTLIIIQKKNCDYDLIRNSNKKSAMLLLVMHGFIKV